MGLYLLVLFQGVFLFLFIYYLVKFVGIVAQRKEAKACYQLSLTINKRALANQVILNRRNAIRDRSFYYKHLI